MKKTPLRSAPRGVRIVSENSSTSTRYLPETKPSAQAPSSSALDTDSGLHIARCWKSPRDKSQCIETTLRSHNGHDFADFRVMALDGSGRMRRTDKGVTVSVKRLGQFAKMAGNAYGMALKLGLTPGSS